MNTIHNQEFDSSIKYGKSSLLDFEECTCGHAPRYENTRDVKNVRWEIDAKVSRLTASKFTDRSEKLTYFSAGPGDFLQDWMILSRLMLLGYTKVDVHLADTSYKIFNNRMKTMQDFFESYPGIEYHVTFYPSIEEFAQKKIPCDLCLAIDWEEMYNSSIPDDQKSTILFSEKGFSYFTKVEPKWVNTAALQIAPKSQYFGQYKF